MYQMLVPELSYDGLEVSDGDMAMLAYRRMCESNEPTEVENIRKALLEYCKLDTLGMVMSQKKYEIERTIIDCLCSKEPLSDENCDYIIKYRGETVHIDYKESFNTDEQREWLNIIRDVLAFANTHGGYIVFGIKDKTFEEVGITEKDWKQLVDPDNIHKKVNTYIQPPLTSITCKHITSDSKNLVVVHIPETIGNTHIIVKEGKFKDHGGKEIIRLKKGEIYVRRSGSSQIIEPTDLEGIINRRINYFKDSLLSKIAKIVEAPIEREVLIIGSGQQEIDVGNKKYILSNDPTAIPVKGLSITEMPTSDESEIASSIALFKKNRDNIPGKNLLYRVYDKRTHLALTRDFFVDLVLINILVDVPCYYWLQFLSRDEINTIVNEVFESGNFFNKSIALRIAGCLGNAYFMKYYNKHSDKRFDDIYRKFHQQGIEGLYFDYGTNNLTAEQLEESAKKLTEKLIKDLNKKERINIFDRDQLWTIDFKLYAKHISKLKG